MLIVTGVVVALIVVGAAVWSLTSRSYDRSSDGCVTVPIASTMGGAIEHACGPAARDWCRAASGGQDAHAQAVRAQCRVAGILP